MRALEGREQVRLSRQEEGRLLRRLLGWQSGWGGWLVGRLRLLGQSKAIVGLLLGRELKSIDIDIM